MARSALSRTPRPKQTVVAHLPAEPQTVREPIGRKPVRAVTKFSFAPRGIDRTPKSKSKSNLTPCACYRRHRHKTTPSRTVPCVWDRAKTRNTARLRKRRRRGPRPIRHDAPARRTLQLSRRPARSPPRPRTARQRGEDAVRLRAAAAPFRAPRRGHRARTNCAARGNRAGRRSAFSCSACFLIPISIDSGETESRAVVKQGRNQTTATARHRGVVRGLRQERRERGTRRAGSRARSRPT